MTKICIIKTGGTFGSVASCGVVALDSSKAENVGRLYSGAHEVQFEEISPFFIHSENIQTHHLKTLLDVIKNINSKKFDGIILTHGTDTLAFTACYLSVMLERCCVPPIAIVSANFPLESPLSNGVINFCKGVDFLCETAGNGVFVCYQNPGENCKIHRADLILQCTGKGGYFESYEKITFGEFTKESTANSREFAKDSTTNSSEFAKIPNQTQKIPNTNCEFSSNAEKLETTFKISETYKQNAEKIGLSAWKSQVSGMENAQSGSGSLATTVLPIKGVAFCNFSLFDLADCSAVVVECFHSGTVPTAGENSIATLCQKASEKNIPVILAGASAGNVYSTLLQLENFKNITYFYGSFEMAFILAALNAF